MAVMRANEIEFFSYSPKQTRRFGRHLGLLLQPGDVILLHGDLGAGKTHFAQGIGLGLDIWEPVRSPTFTLVNEYEEARLPLYHMDLYRSAGDASLSTIGLDEYFDGEGVVVVEWPEKGADWLPSDALHIFLYHFAELRRRIRLETGGPRSKALLRAFQKHTFARGS